jgi:NADH-quinone oxidoreductase subunit H
MFAIIKKVFPFALPIFIIQLVPILGWLERKVSALIQNRVGPNKARIFGLTFGGLPHMLADFIKFVTKENFKPKGTSYLLFTLAPIIKVLLLLIPFVFIPWLSPFSSYSPHYSLTLLPNKYSIVYIVLLTQLSIYGIFLAGLTSQSKYSKIGMLRSVAGMLSYEIAFVTLVLAIAIYFNSYDLEKITNSQDSFLYGYIPHWGIFINPLGFLLFLIVSFIETQRTPFDIPEGEAEIVDGYRTEYSGVKLVLFFLAEYIGIILMSTLISVLYLGGGSVGFVSINTLIKSYGLKYSIIITFLVLWLKIFLFCLFFIWVRWTLPRLRYDQLLNFGWKFVLPLSFINFLTTLLLKKEVYL